MNLTTSIPTRQIVTAGREMKRLCRRPVETLILEEWRELRAYARSDDKTYTYFDLETSGLTKPQIVQIAAKTLDDRNEVVDSCNLFSVPSCAIEEGASAMTGVWKNDGKLYKKDDSQKDMEIPCVDIKDALQKVLQMVSCLP